MSDALVPIEQRTVEFYEDEITAVLVDVDGEQQVYVPVRPIVERLGLAFGSQRNRINRDPVLSVETRIVFITNTNPSGGNPNVLCLPLKFLPGFLFGISADRVRPELREKVILYQRECYDVLAEAFVRRTDTADTSSTTTALVQIRETALAVARLADEQLALNARLNKAAVVVAGHEKRIQILEQRLDPGNPITDEQASEVGQKVAALAMFLTERDGSKNHFQGIFGELHRQFRVTSYKLIPVGKYAAVLEFLDKWLGRAQKGG